MTLVLTALAAAFRSPLARVLTAACALLGLLCLADARGFARGRLAGAAAERGGWESRLAADKASAAQVAASQAAAGVAVGAALAERQAEIRTVTQTLVREVPRYVTPEADARCNVPVGLVRLHDAAAAGLPAAPDPAGRADDAASGLALSAVTAAVADNYGLCHAAEEQVRGWQAWWGAVSAARSEAEGRTRP